MMRSTCSKPPFQIDGAGRYRIASMLERLARDSGNKTAYARALETQAELVISALTDPAEGDRLGVPRFVRQQEVVADAWLRASDARRQLGDLPAAAALLDRALERVGPRSPILTARLAVAEASGDTATAERLAETMLDQGVTGASAASLFMRVAEAAANRDDAPGALAALNKALEADRGCIPARALQIDLLGNAADSLALAAALEAMAGELPSDEAKGRAFLLSAYVFAIQARDVSGAKAALTQAGACGLSPGLLARTARMFAAVLEDDAWFDDATRRLIASGGEAAEQLSLWFEVGRTRALRGDHAGAARAFESMTKAEGGGWLGPALGTYALAARAIRQQEETSREAWDGDPRKAVAPELLDRLRAAESDGPTMRALSLAAARRADLAGDLDQACARLHELFDSDPTDLTCGVYLADLEKRAGRSLPAAKVLATSASTASDPELAGSLHLEAAVLLWRAGERRVALDELEAALTQTATSAAPLFAWALRGIDAMSVEERRRVLDRSLELSHEEQLLGLERLALELFSTGATTQSIKVLLEDAEHAAVGELASAAALARILWDERGVDRDAFVGALEHVSASHPSAAPIAAWEKLRLARLENDKILACQSARAFADSVRSLPANLEWLGAAMSAGDRGGEIAARRTIAGAFSGEARSALLASAAMVSLIDSPGGAEPAP